MRISVIMPALNEAASIGESLASARTGTPPGQVEIIVVDGGSSDLTVETARRLADQVLVGPKGRARQMNCGASAACGEVLLFLHADTALPPRYWRAIELALSEPAVVGGRFDLRLDGKGALLGATAALINLRSRLSRIATGDQAIFVRRGTFAQLGGYADLPLFEDIVLTRALKRVGATACLRQKVTTSARRWQQQGTVRTIWRMWLLRGLFWLGVPAETLHNLYRDVR